MREEKNLRPSPKKLQQQKWFWPAIYVGLALAIVIGMSGYNMLAKKEQAEVPEEVAKDDKILPPVIETNTAQENMKFPFSELYVNDVEVRQDFYDVAADAKTREKALLVFKQSFTNSTGLSLVINNEPFEVLAAMSGTVTKVKLDVFKGNSMTIEHANGLQTRYSSITDIVVKEGDTVIQGQPIATTTSNEWNQAAGTHLHFEVLENGKAINPRKLLAF